MDDKKLSLADWRKARRHEMVLPSGLPVVLRYVDMTDILMSGKLPASVLEMSKKAAQQSDEIDLQELGADMMQENAAEFLTLLNAITEAALVEPAIGAVSGDETITLDELPMSDKTAIMEWVNRGDAAVRSFRPGEREPVEAA